MRLPNDVKLILNLLEEKGYEAYAVGGCVRDTLLGKEPKDWDICTNAKPNEVMSVFGGFQIIETGLQHGTVTVVVNSVGYEITTYRIDGEYSDGRHPDAVEYTTNLAEDLSRRDFTINAMAYSEKEGIVDLFGGIEDLKAGKIKCVGIAKDRFNEDALRILRALRFASVLGFIIEKETKDAIFELYTNLDKIAAERINVEFSKMILGINNVKILREYEEVYSYIIPEIKKMVGFEQHTPWHRFDVWEHTLAVVKRVGRENLPLALAAIFHDIGKPKAFFIGDDGFGHFYGHPDISVEIAEEILKRLKYSNEIIDETLWLVKYHDNDYIPNKKYVRKMLGKAGNLGKDSKEMLGLLLKLRRADVLGQSYMKRQERLAEVDILEDILRDFEVENDCFTLKQLNLNGNDLMEMGMKPGKEMGVILNDLLEKVMNEELENNKEILVKFVREKYGI